MTTRSIDPGEVAACNNGSYTGHTSGEGEAHTAGSCVAICNGGGKAYSYAVLRDDEIRTHDVVVPRGGENDVPLMAHTAVMRQKAHGDVVARGFEDKEPTATREVGGSSGVQAMPRRALMRTPCTHRGLELGRQSPLRRLWCPAIGLTCAGQGGRCMQPGVVAIMCSADRRVIRVSGAQYRRRLRHLHAAKCRGYHVLTRRSYRIAEHSTADRRQGEKAVPEDSLRC
ncbi:hypothetical protein JKP88DRAFT_255844 [Tribonema minus]|nr:hypothetical protein JKP88DRAFT_255844 [Tribonema minus]